MYISPVGLGCMGFSHAYGTTLAKDEAIKRIRKAHELGYTLFNTAECYTGVYADGSYANNEEVVGEALKPIRNQVILATKFGIKFTDQGSILDSSPQKIRESLEGSLKRLQTDRIDLYYQHRIDPKVEPKVVAWVMKELIVEGKIKAWGISEVKEDYLRRAHAVCPVSAIQNRYSMVARGYENMFIVCKELGINFVAYSPLENGTLSGKYDPSSKFEDIDFRTHRPLYKEEGFGSVKK